MLPLAEALSVPTVDTADMVRLELFPCVHELLPAFWVIFWMTTLPLLVNVAAADDSTRLCDYLC